MQRGRRHHVSSVCADIDTRRQPDLVADDTSRMREVEMAATATGPAVASLCSTAAGGVWPTLPALARA